MYCAVVVKGTVDQLPRDSLGGAGGVVLLLSVAVVKVEELVSTVR